MRYLRRLGSSRGQRVTRLGIIVGGLLAFVVLAAACVAQHGAELSGAGVPGTSPIAVPAPELPAPMLRAEFSASRLALTGRVPNSAVRDAVVERAQRIYGAAQVSERLEISAVAPQRWLNAAFPPDLRDASHAVALLQDGRLLVEGETPTDAARARLDAGLLPLAQEGITLHVRLNTGIVQAVDPDSDNPAGLARPPKTPP